MLVMALKDCCLNIVIYADYVMLLVETQNDFYQIIFYDAISIIDLKMNLPKTMELVFDMENRVNNFKLHKWQKERKKNLNG